MVVLQRALKVWDENKNEKKIKVKIKKYEK